MVVDVVTFSLRPEADTASFLEADKELQALVSIEGAGFIRRTTARSDDGTWLVVSLWATQPDVDASAAGTDATRAAFMGYLDTRTLTRQVFLTLD
jgi:hypothetical protein